MPSYIARRLLQAALILLGVAAITYLLLYMLPADPARMVAGRTANKEQVEIVRAQLASTCRSGNSLLDTSGSSPRVTLAAPICSAPR